MREGDDHRGRAPLPDDEDDAWFERADLALRLFCLLVGLGTLGLLVHVGGIVCDGVATGCIAARSGQHCQDAAPVCYAVTLLLNTLAAVLWLTGAIMALVCAWRPPR